MTPPPELLDLIREFEGLRLRPYLCPAGVPTVGYGHTGPEVRMGGPRITRELAEIFLREDAGRAVQQAIKLSPVCALYPGALSAVADFIYNLGATRYKASTLRRRVNMGDWEEAGVEIMRWVWGGGQKLPGLLRRRERERLLLP